MIAEASVFEIPDVINTPSLVVDIGRATRNLEAMQLIADIHGVDLVPHFKTHRTVEFAQLQMRFGAKAMCVAKLGEAEALLEAGFTRFVMAYPLVGPTKIARAIELAAKSDLTVSLEDLSQAQALSDAAVRESVVISVLILVDTGYRREGIRPVGVADFATSLSRMPGVRLRGLLTHEGHASAAADAEELEALSVDAGRQMVELAEALRASGHAIDVVSVGSTASARYIVGVPGVTQLRPGIYPFNDYGQVLRGTATLDDCAAFVVSTVISTGEPGRALIDAGSKALSQDRLAIWSPEAPDGHGLVVNAPGWKLERLSEEHGWLVWAGDGDPPPMPLGRRLVILPNHICSVFHVLGRAEVVENGSHSGTWTATARGESQ
jgi:D-serine deaminase-like pyridoxal phosphate-dependent protein